MELEDYIRKLLPYYGFPKNVRITRIRSGFNRAVFEIDGTDFDMDKFIIKICTDITREKEVENEIEFYKNNHFRFTPSSFRFIDDTSKEKVPFVYTIESYINGETLFSKWGCMSDEERHEALEELVSILKQIHSRKIPGYYDEFNPQTLIDGFYKDLDRCRNQKLFSYEQLEHLWRIKDIFPKYLEGAKTGFIHGDIHFDNVIVTPDNSLKLIDFENYGVSILDKEFDEINRMCKSPQSFTTRGQINEKDFQGIMPTMESLYPELCEDPNYRKRLIIYDCINAIRWIQMYPDCQRYYDTLFGDSQKLIRKK